MTTHELKTWPHYFQAVIDGRKTFEVRANDREFCEGDRLRLREYEQKRGYYSGEYTGREVTVDVTYILSGGRLAADFNYKVLDHGFVVIAFSMRDAT